MVHPIDLTWPDVDPATHPFDPAAAAAVVAALPPAESVQASSAWTDSMTTALVGHYGSWAVGWRWAPDEGELGGGPVGVWCCPPHSIGGQDETLAKVAAALCDWRAWLTELAARFAATDDWHAAVLDLVSRVIARTNAGDVWYSHCHQVLTWYLTSRGVSADAAEQLVEEAIGGRFESWREPDPTVISAVAEHLGNAT